uniref:G protein-coupled receptor n=1 Tax=Steinernema glaseri TaxID=37863 RepID=A0A1I7ZP38_9BILA
MTNAFLQAMAMNSILACFMSLLINAILIYMIWFHSTADLKNYRTFFLIYTAIDVCFTAVILPTHMIFICHDRSIVLVASGFITYFGRRPSQFLATAQMFFNPFSIAIIPCTYIYRYLLICRNIRLRPRYILLLFVGAFFVTLPFLFSSRSFPSATSENVVLFEKMILSTLKLDNIEGYYYVGNSFVRKSTY